jgi:hypothetical protein
VNCLLQVTGPLAETTVYEEPAAAAAAAGGNGGEELGTAGSLGGGVTLAVAGFGVTGCKGRVGGYSQAQFTVNFAPLVPGECGASGQCLVLGSSSVNLLCNSQNDDAAGSSSLESVCLFLLVVYTEGVYWFKQRLDSRVFLTKMQSASQVKARCICFLNLGWAPSWMAWLK